MKFSVCTIWGKIGILYTLFIEVRIFYLFLKSEFQKERQKTAGDGWFGMKAPELTDELKNDLKALKMRAGMDPKRFYKKNDRDGFPKYFQVGSKRNNGGDVLWILAWEGSTIL